MKRMMLLLSLFVTAWFGVQAEECCDDFYSYEECYSLDDCYCDCCDCFTVEAKAAYFYPTSHKYRKLYSGSGLYGIELGAKLCDQWSGWFSVNALYKKGHSRGCGLRTEVTQVPIDFGIKYTMCGCNCMRPYLGAGLLITYLRLHDHSHHLRSKIHRWGVGGIFKAGLQIDLPCCFFLDLFTNYSLITVTPKGHHHGCRHKADLSGFSFGGGIGYNF